MTPQKSRAASFLATLLLIASGPVVAGAAMIAGPTAPAAADTTTPPYPVSPEAIIDPNQVYGLVLQANNTSPPSTLASAEADANTAYASAQNFESHAIQEVCQDHQMSPCDASMILGFAPADVRAQEWVDLDALITEHHAGTFTCPSGVDTAGGLTADDCNIYYWFELVNQQQSVAADQDAINEYAKWAGISTSDLTAQPVPFVHGSTTEGFCNYQPPGGSTSPFTYTGNQNPVCGGACPEELAIIGGCDPTYPSINDFQEWGKWDADQSFETPDYWAAMRQTAEAEGPALGAAIGSLVTTPISSALGATGLSGTALQQAIFPFANRANFEYSGALSRPAFRQPGDSYETSPEEDVAAESPDGASEADVAAEAGEAAADGAADTATDIAAVSSTALTAGAVVFVVGIVIFAIVTIAMEIYTIVTDSEIAPDLQNTLTNDQNTLPDLYKLFGGTSNFATGLGVFTSATNMTPPLPCVGTVFSSTGGPDTPDCTDEPTIPSADPSDPVAMTTQSDGTSSIGHSFYFVDASGMFDTARVADNGMFVVTKYSPVDANNASAPVDPGATIMTTTIDYLDWNGDAWAAQLVSPPGASAPEFISYALDSDNESSCAQCASSHLQMEQPDGWTALPALTVVTLEPATADEPTATVFFPDPIVLGQSASFTAYGTDPQNQPLTYTWTFPNQWSNDSLTCELGSACSTPEKGQTVNYTFTTAGNKFGELTVSNGAESSTTKFLINVADRTNTTVSSSQDPSVYGQPVTVTATVSPDEVYGNDLETLFYPVVTGDVQFYLDGQPYGSAEPLQLPDPRDTITPDSTASITLPSNAAATAHTIQAVYLGNPTYTQSGNDPTQASPPTDLDQASALLTQTVDAGGTTTAVTSSANPSAYGMPVTFTASVSPSAPALGTASGAVQFAIDGTNVGGLVNLDSYGQATMTTDLSDVLAQTGSGTAWPTGHSVTATFWPGFSSSCGYFCFPIDPAFASSSGALTQSSGDGQDVGPAPSPPVVIDQDVTVAADGCGTFNVLSGSSDWADTVVASTTAVVAPPSSPNVLQNNHDGTMTFCFKPGGPTTGSFTYDVQNTGTVDPVTNPSGTPQTSNVATVTVTAGRTRWYAYANGAAAAPSACPLTTTPAKQCTLSQALSLAPNGSLVLLEGPSGGATFVGAFSASSSVTIVPASGTGSVTLEDGGSDTVLSVPNSNGLYRLSVHLRHVSITGGGGGDGGCVFTDGSLVLDHVTITGCTSAVGGGALVGGDGSLSLNDSTVSDNTAFYLGGGIASFGTLHVTRSTIDANFVPGVLFNVAQGGGLYTDGSTSLKYSTLSGDSASVGSEIANAGGAESIVRSTIAGASSGNGLVADEGGTVAVAGSILDDANGDDCAGGISDEGWNLENDAAGTCGFSASRHDVVGVDPQLAALGNFGGPTQTILPASTSPALDRIGASAVAHLNGVGVQLCAGSDQRGVASGTSPFFCPMGSVQEIDPNLPVISSISRHGGPIAGGTVILITGTNLAGATGVSVDGVPVAGFSVNPGGSITATTASAPSPVIGEVSVTTPEGTSPHRVGLNFVYQGKAQILWSDAPTSGYAGFPVGFDATTTSGAPVTYTVTTPSTCTLIPGEPVVVLTGPPYSTCTVVATAPAAPPAYFAAPPVTDNIEILPIV